MSPLAALRIGGAVAVLLLAAWALRVNGLRAEWQGRTEVIVQVVAEASCPAADRACVQRIGWRQASDRVREIAATRDRFRAEREAAKAVISQQNGAIEDLRAEGERRRQESERRLAEIRRLTAERERWIAAAQDASTRTERLDAEAELAICEAAMDALYQAGF